MKGSGVKGRKGNEGKGSRGKVGWMQGIGSKIVDEREEGGGKERGREWNKGRNGVEERRGRMGVEDVEEESGGKEGRK